MDLYESAVTLITTYHFNKSWFFFFFLFIKFGVKSPFFFLCVAVDPIEVHVCNGYKFLAKIFFSSLNYTWVSFFVPELWRICFSSLNFEKVHFYTWILSFYKIIQGRNSCVKNEFFQRSGIKNELFKIQGRKTNFIQSLETKTIV